MDKCHLDTKWLNDTEYSAAIRRYLYDTNERNEWVSKWRKNSYILYI